MSYLIRFDAKSNRICIKYILRFLSINSKNGNASTFFWVKRDIQSEKKTSPRRNVLKNSIWFAVDQCNWLKQWKWSFLHVKEVKFNLKEKTSRWTRNEPIFFLNSSNFDKLYLWCLVFRVFVFYSFIFLVFFFFICMSRLKLSQNFRSMEKKESFRFSLKIGGCLILKF